MDCIKQLNSYDEVKILVSKIQERRIASVLGLKEEFQEYYRGQVSSRFLLIPSLFRNGHGIVSIGEIERQLIEEFKSEIRAKELEKFFLPKPLTAGKYNEEWYWLSQAQHCELPTRLLDWTLKWEVALYFAVEEREEHNHEDGQFWVFSPPSSIILNDSRRGEFLEIHPLDFKMQNLINPPFSWTGNYENEIAEMRRARQHGKFFIQSISNSIIPMEAQPHLISKLEKYCIPKEEKPKIRKELSERGFVKEFLYPELNPEVKSIIRMLREKHLV